MDTQELTRSEIEQIIVNNAARHPQYRQMLVENPKRTIELQMNNRLPDSISVEVLEESAERIYVRLPFIVDEGAELSDEDLEEIAGGKGKGGNHYACNQKPGGFNTRNEFDVGL